MRPSRLAFASAPIPFRGSFGHASARRDRAENVLAVAEDENGHRGLGEGCPRSYVTGETAEGARAFLERHRGALLRLDGVDALSGWIERHKGEIDANPSAFCAAELALLDLFARQREQSIEAFLGLEPLRGALTVTAVYGTGSWVKFGIAALLFAANRMRDSKLKLSGEEGRDAARAALLARRGRLRLDANNLWPDADAALRGLTKVAPHAWAVEEPLPARDWHGLRKIAADTGLSIILDESLTRIEDLDHAPEDGAFIPNLRVSKLGGLLRSLALLRRALQQGRTVVVGAQVGETSILARAGLAITAAAQDRLAGYEGGYGTWLLTEDAASPPVRFGRNGRLEPGAWASGAGLGLEPLPAFTNAFGR
jgi:L-alanine-DL-glutamate epimerase-like enolase superfamily enzyme